MKKAITIGAVAVLTACALLAIWVRFGGKPKRSPLVAEKGDVSGELAARLAGLERKTSMLQTRLTSVESNAAPPRSASAEQAEKDETDAEQAAKFAKLTPAEHDKLVVQSVKSTFEHEVAHRKEDPIWTADTTDVMSRRVAEPEFVGSKLTDVACREGLCRIRMRHDDEEAWTSFRKAFKQEPFKGSTFFSFDPKTNQSVIYMSRPGEALPKVPPLTL